MGRKTFKLKDHKIKALIFGDSGTGKTTFGGTAKNAVFLSAESGLLALGKEVEYYDIKTLGDLKSALIELRKEVEAGTCPFDTIIIDSITEINDIIKDAIEKENGTMTFKERGELSTIIMGVIKGFKELPLHVIVIAHQKLEKDDDRLIKYLPSLNGKAAKKICYYMDIVGYTEILKSEEGVKYSLVVEPKRYAPTKCRGGFITDKTPADLEVWKEIINGATVDQKSPPVSDTRENTVAYSEILESAGLDPSHEAGLLAIKTIEKMDKDQVQEGIETLNAQIKSSKKLSADDKKKMKKLSDFLLSYF